MAAVQVICDGVVVTPGDRVVITDHLTMRCTAEEEEGVLYDATVWDPPKTMVLWRVVFALHDDRRGKGRRWKGRTRVKPVWGLSDVPCTLEVTRREPFAFAGFEEHAGRLYGPRRGVVKQVWGDSGVVAPAPHLVETFDFTVRDERDVRDERGMGGRPGSRSTRRSGLRRSRRRPQTPGDGNRDGRWLAAWSHRRVA